MEVQSKSAFYDLWQRGLLGNRPRAWSSLSDLLASDYCGPVTIRYKGHAGGGRTVTHILRDAVPDVLAQWTSEGTAVENTTFHESMPDDELLLQGEVARLAGLGLELTYSTEKGTPMRAAMLAPRRARGAAAKVILDSFLDANSREDLSDLLDLYPEAVIEFGAYARFIGILPRRNTVIWEVRNY